MRGWIYRSVIFSFPTIFGGGDDIVTLYFHPWQYLVRGWIYRDITFSLLTIFGQGVIISWHYIFTPDNIWSGGDYIVTLYFRSWQYLVRGWLYRDIIFSLLTIFGQEVIISWHYIFTADNIWSGGDYIVTLYFHSWQYLVRGWLYRDIIFSLLTIFGQGLIISWHYIFTPGNIWSGGDYIVTLYFHSWQYLVGGWLYRDIIFSLLTIFGAGVIISWHYHDYIFTPGNIWSGGDYIVTLYFHCWQYLVRGWLYHDTLFSPLTIFGQGVIISWHHMLTPDNISWGGDYIVTWYSHPWQYLVREWLYRDIIFSLLALFGEGVIISWHYIFAPGNIWSVGDYIVTLYFRSWQYLVRGWLYLDIVLSLLAIFGEGVIISWHIFTPEDIWWGGDYIVTLQYHFWHYPRIWHWRWLYLNISTMQIWLRSDTRVLLFISIYSPHETWGVEVIIFKHDTLFAVET